MNLVLTGVWAPHFAVGVGVSNGMWPVIQAVGSWFGKLTMSGVR